MYIVLTYSIWGSFHYHLNDSGMNLYKIAYHFVVYLFLVLLPSTKNKYNKMVLLETMRLLQALKILEVTMHTIS